nr:MFS transporter [Ornithinimicrobium kibberense]
MTVGSVLPVFLLGANGPQVMADLKFDAGGLGAVAGSYTIGLAVASLGLGRWLDRSSLPRAVLTATGLGIAGGVTAAATSSLPMLAIGLFASGVSSSTYQMSAGRILQNSVGGGGHGVAFGWFQSAKPVAVAVAGAFGMLATLGVGWRASFAGVTAVTAVLAAVLALWCVDHEPGTQKRSIEGGSRQGIVLLAALMALGFGLTNISTTFLSDTVQVAGPAALGSGALLTVGGLLAAVGRVAAGRLTDVTGWDELALVAPAFIAAGIGSILVGTLAWSAIVTGFLLIFALGWAFGGLLVAQGTRRYPGNSAAVVGVLLVGGAIGGSVSPPIFGAAATTWGYDVAWRGWGVAMLIAGLCAGVLAFRRQHSGQRRLKGGSDS